MRRVERRRAHSIRQNGLRMRLISEGRTDSAEGQSDEIDRMNPLRGRPTADTTTRNVLSAIIRITRVSTRGQMSDVQKNPTMLHRRLRCNIRLFAICLGFRSHKLAAKSTDCMQRVFTAHRTVRWWSGLTEHKIRIVQRHIEKFDVPLVSRETCCLRRDKCPGKGKIEGFILLTTSARRNELLSSVRSSTNRQVFNTKRTKGISVRFYSRSDLPIRLRYLQPERSAKAQRVSVSRRDRLRG